MALLLAGMVGVRRLRAAVVLVALLSLSELALAREVGRVAVECVAATGKVSFDLDFDRRTVVGAFPVNWRWFARDSVLFGYSAEINGVYETMQSYTLDHAAGTLDVCDFASGDDQACERRQCSSHRADRHSATLRQSAFRFA